MCSGSAVTWSYLRQIRGDALSPSQLGLSHVCNPVWWPLSSSTTPRACKTLSGTCTMMKSPNGRLTTSDVTHGGRHIPTTPSTLLCHFLKPGETLERSRCCSPNLDVLHSPTAHMGRNITRFDICRADLSLPFPRTMQLKQM